MAADLSTYPVSIYPVTGPPGAGKTTALRSIERQHPTVARFGVRDYGLRLADAGDPLGLAMRETLMRNELLADELVLRELAHFLDHLPADVRSVAVEGYPRDLRQCADLVRAVRVHRLRLGAFIAVEMPEDVVHARVAGRRICLRCGLPTSVAVADTCQECRGTVIARTDDEPARLVRRLRDYRTLGADVRAYFAERGLLRTVDGLACPAQVRRSLLAVLLGEQPSATRLRRGPRLRIHEEERLREEERLPGGGSR